MNHAGYCGRLVLLVGVLTLWGCAAGRSTGPAAPGLPVGSRITLPEDARALGGVACEFYKSGGDQALEQFEIRCPGWERYTGLLWRGQIPRPAASWEETLFQSSDLASTVQAIAACGEPEAASILNDQPAYIRRCTSYNGGFPYLLIAAGVDNRAYVLWGPAHLATLFESFIQTSQQGEAQTTLAGSQSQLIALAEQTLMTDGRLIGLEDMGQFVGLDQLSTLYNSAKNHPRALELAQRALEIHERIKGVDDPSSGYLVARIARELSRLQPGAAEPMFQRAEPLVKASADESAWPEFLVYRAWHELDHGDRVLAEQYAQQSWEISQAAAARAQQGAINPRIAHSLIGIGDVYMELDKLDDAESAYRQALEIFDTVRGGDYYWVGESHDRLAEGYRRRQAFAQARTEAQAAIDLKRALFGEGRALAESLAILAVIEHEAKQAQRALELWRETRRILLSDRAARTQLRTTDLEDYLSLLFELAAAESGTAKTALLEEAFTVSQLGQTPAAGRAITQMAARLAESNPAVQDTARALQDALKTTQDLQYELGLEQSKPALARDRAKEEALKAQLREAAAEYQRQEEQLQAKFPRYGQLVSPEPLVVEEIAALLKQGEALFRILPGKTATWGFLINPDGSLQGVEVDVLAQQLTEQVERLRAGVDVSGGTLPDFNTALAYDLYQQLLGPLDTALNGVNHLIMVPAGPLLSLPPTLLVRQSPTNPGDYQEVGWLVKDMAVSILPSVVALQQFRQVARTSQATLPFIGLGDPIFSNQRGTVRGGVADITQQCRIDAAVIAQLPQLPETADELRILAQTLGADPKRSVVLGRQANVPNVQAANLQDYRIIAFATHALLPGELDCLTEPALALTPQTADSVNNNGLLGASAIAELRLDADWVLLSACNTAGEGGGQLRGEGLSGLATAFLYAGARSLLASHWYVVSEPTVALTTRTFESFQQAPERGRAEALRRAQLSLLNDANTAHPVFWAAFTLIGDNGRL
ncbi:MAG: CHAT domain-containing protein [Candidatus Competibacteraceae bacterium]|jgi:CHAT domain-containing protein|nr:CHAT domain-containing protein [Candidatus Competibacteraceae bacterium]